MQNDAGPGPARNDGGAAIPAASSTSAAEPDGNEGEASATIDVSTPAPESTVASPEANGQDHGPVNRLLDEIVVTAQKREEALMDVPLSVTAFSADQLDAKGIQDPKALQLAVPGLQWNVFGSYSIIYLRGIGSRAFIPSAAPSVAPYIDNIYYPFGLNLASALGEVERVEVLKGPQGTLFGRDSPGGAINIVTKEPGHEFTGSVQAIYGSFDKLNLRAYLNVPVYEDLALSVSGLRYREDSYYHLDADSGRDSIPKDKSDAYQIKAKWTPLDDLSAVLGYSYLKTSSGTTSMLPASDTKPLGTTLGVTERPDYETAENAPAFVETAVKVASADLKYHTGWFDTRLILADQAIGPPKTKIPPNAPHEIDFDGSDQPLVTFAAPHSFADVTTAEFQLLSNDEAPDWLKWIAGVYYLDSSVGYDPALFAVGESALPVLSADPDGPLQQVISRGVEILGDAALGQAIDHGVTLVFHGVMDTKTSAVFTQGTVDFTDWMSLTLGGRLTRDERRLVKADTNLVVNPQDPVNDYVLLFNLLPDDRQSTLTKFSPKAVVDFHVFDDDLVYVSYSEGFKSGTYNIVNIYRRPNFVKPETTTTYEIGYKGTLLDGGMRFTAAIFRNEIKNLQEQIISLLSSGAARFENAGKARIEGAEFDVTWQILPRTLPGLTVVASAAYLDGKYLSYPNGSGYDSTTGLYRDQGFDFTGNKTVATPKLTGTLEANYTFDIGASTFEVASDVYHNDGFYYTPQNSGYTKERAYSVVNGRISCLYKPWDLRVTAYGKNINSAKYHYAVADLDFGTGKLLAPPDTYGLQMTWNF